MERIDESEEEDDEEDEDAMFLHQVSCHPSKRDSAMKQTTMVCWLLA
jgi:hypothetical protein